MCGAVKELVTMAGGVLQPHLICGDFNSPPLTSAYHVVTEGYLDDRSMAALQTLTKVMLPDGKVRFPKYLIHVLIYLIIVIILIAGIVQRWKSIF